MYNFSSKDRFCYGHVSFGTDCSLYYKATDSLVTFLSHSVFNDYLPVDNGVMEITETILKIYNTPVLPTSYMGQKIGL